MLVGDGDLALTFIPAEAPASDLTYECFSDNPSLIPDFDIMVLADDEGAEVAVAIPGVTADAYLASGNTATDVAFTCAPSARVGKVEPWMSFAFRVHVSTKLVVVIGSGGNTRSTAAGGTVSTDQDITAPAAGVDCKTVVVYEGEAAITQIVKVYSPIRPAGGASVTITCTDSNGYLTGDTAETGSDLSSLTAAGIANARAFDTTALPTDIPPAEDVPGRVTCTVSDTDEASGDERFVVDTDFVSFDYHLVPLRLTASASAITMFERNSITGAFSLEINHGSAVSVSCSAPEGSVIGTVDVPSVTTSGVAVNVNWNSSAADMQSTDTVEITCEPGTEANGWTPGEDVVTLTATVQPIRLRVMYGGVEITNGSTAVFEIYEQQDDSTALDIMTNASHNGTAGSTVNVDCEASPAGYIAVDGTITAVGTSAKDIPLIAVSPGEQGYADVPKGATREVIFTCGATTATATGGLTDGTTVSTDKVTFRVRVLPIEATIRTVTNNAVTLRYSTGDAAVLSNTNVGTLPVVLIEGDNLNNRLKIRLSASPAASVSFECSTGAPLDPTGTVVPVSVPTTGERNISYPTAFANSVPPTGSTVTSVCRVTGETNTIGVAPGESVSVTIQYVAKRIYAVGGTAAEDSEEDAIDGDELTTAEEWLAVLADETLDELDRAIELSFLEDSIPAVYEGTAIGSNIVSIAANRDVSVAGSVVCVLAEGSPEGIIEPPAEAFTLNATGTTSIPFDTTAAAVDEDTYVWFDCSIYENIVGGTSPDTYTIMGAGEGFTNGILVMPIQLEITPDTNSKQPGLATSYSVSIPVTGFYVAEDQEEVSNAFKLSASAALFATEEGEATEAMVMCVSDAPTIIPNTEPVKVTGTGTVPVSLLSVGTVMVDTTVTLSCSVDEPAAGLGSGDVVEVVVNVIANRIMAVGGPRATSRNARGATLEDEYLDPGDSDVEDLVEIVPIVYEGADTEAGAVARIKLNNAPKESVKVTCSTPEGSVIGAPEDVELTNTTAVGLDFPAPAAVDLPVNVQVTCMVVEGTVDTGYVATDMTSFRVRVMPNRIVASPSSLRLYEKAGAQANAVQLSLAAPAFVVDTTEGSTDAAEVLVLCESSSPTIIDVEETQKSEGILLKGTTPTSLALTNPADVREPRLVTIVCRASATQGGMKSTDEVSIPVTVLPVVLTAIGGTAAQNPAGDSLVSDNITGGGAGLAVAVSSIGAAKGAGVLVRLRSETVTTALTLNCSSDKPTVMGHVNGVTLATGTSVVQNLTLPAPNLVTVDTLVTYACRATNSAEMFYAETVSFQVHVVARALQVFTSVNAYEADTFDLLDNGVLVDTAILALASGETLDDAVKVRLTVWPEKDVTVVCTTTSTAIAEASRSVSVTISSSASRDLREGVIPDISAATVTSATDAVFTCNVPCPRSGYDESTSDTFTVKVYPPALRTVSTSSGALMQSVVVPRGFYPDLDAIAIMPKTTPGGSLTLDCTAPSIISDFSITITAPTSLTVGTPVRPLANRWTKAVTSVAYADVEEMTQDTTVRVTCIPEDDTDAVYTTEDSVAFDVAFRVPGVISTRGTNSIMYDMDSVAEVTEFTVRAGIRRGPGQVVGLTGTTTTSVYVTSCLSSDAGLMADFDVTTPSVGTDSGPGVQLVRSVSDGAFVSSSSVTNLALPRPPSQPARITYTCVDDDDETVVTFDIVTEVPPTVEPQAGDLVVRIPFRLVFGEDEISEEAREAIKIVLARKLAVDLGVDEDRVRVEFVGGRRKLLQVALNLEAIIIAADSDEQTEIQTIATTVTENGDNALKRSLADAIVEASNSDEFAALANISVSDHPTGREIPLT